MPLGDSVDGMGGVDNAVLMRMQQEYQQMNQTMAQFQLDFASIEEAIENNLNGLKWNEKSGKFERIYQPIMGERGIKHIMKKVKFTITKITAQSNYDEETIRRWCILLWTELTFDCYAFGDSWGLDQDEYHSLVHDVVFQVQAIMLAALHGGLREVVGKMTKVVESFNMGGQDKKTVKL